MFNKLQKYWYLISIFYFFINSLLKLYFKIMKRNSINNLINIILRILHNMLNLYIFFIIL